MAGHHAEFTLRNINENRQNDEYCDFAVKVNGKSLKVHRLILGSYSPYFRAMFASQMQEPRQGFVDVQDVGEEVVKQCIDYIYTGKAIPNMASVEGVIKLASMWQLSKLIEKCVVFLNESIDFKTCFRIKNIATLHQFEDLENKCDSFILDNIEGVVREGNFSDLKKEHLVQYVKMAQARYFTDRTDTLFHFLNAWHEACAVQDGNTFCEVLLLVQIEHCEVSFVEQEVWNNRHVATCCTCKVYVANEVLGNCETGIESIPIHPYDEFASFDADEIPETYEKHQVDETNCFFLKSLSKAYKHKEVEECVDEYITRDFEKLSEMPKFLEIPQDDFLSYLRSSAVGDIELQRLAKIIVKWILHDEKVRKEQFSGFEACLQLYDSQPRMRSIPARSKIMSSSFLPEIWFCMKAFANKFDCPILGSNADKRILENFHNILKRPEFKNLDKNDLVTCVSSDRLKDIPTSDIWKALVDWVKHDVAKREEDFPAIFESIDFKNTPMDFLKNTVCSEPLVKNSTACKDALMSHLFGRVGELEKDSADLKRQSGKMKKEMSSVKDRINALEKSRKVSYSKKFAGYEASPVVDTKLTSVRQQGGWKNVPQYWPGSKSHGDQSSPLTKAPTN